MRLINIAPFEEKGLAEIVVRYSKMGEQRTTEFVYTSTVPTIDAVPMKKAHWIKKGNEKTCSGCGFIYYSNNDDWNYCPNCGAGRE